MTETGHPAWYFVISRTVSSGLYPTILDFLGYRHSIDDILSNMHSLLKCDRMNSILNNMTGLFINSNKFFTPCGIMKFHYKISDYEININNLA